MTLGLHETRLRRRRRRRLAILKWTLVLGALVAAGFYAYQTGSVLARYEVNDLRGELRDLAQTTATLRQQRDALIAERDAARQREQALEARYRKDVPTGPARELFGLVQQRLAGGIPPDRLAFVINATTPERKCDGSPETKRFIVRIPGYEGGNDSVGFANSTIRVTAEGEAAVAAGGAPEGWYDPAKPVTVRFARLGGAATEASGLLPLHHSVIKDGKDYRFTIAPGPRGFVLVTGDRCNFP